MERVLTLLRDEGDGALASVPMFDFKTFCEMIGFDEVWAFERKWGGEGSCRA